MVDYPLNLDLWLQEASLFRDEPIDIDDFFSTEKADTEGKQTALIQPGLDWFDEKVDLSVLNNPDSLLVHRNETQPSMEDDTAFLLGLLDSSFNPSYFASDVFKNEEIDFSKSLDTPNYVPEPASSEILDTHLASPQCNLLQVNSPFFVQSPASPSYSDISEAHEETSSNYLLQSPESSTVTSDSAGHSIDTSQIRVTVCDAAVESPASSELALSIDEVSRSVRKRKFVNYGEEIPKVKVIITEYPRSNNSTPKPKDRRERKKVQNKEAAARYRTKKRNEDKELSDVVESLESRQNELQEKHDNLNSEIKYLKSLMCEILQKKGILK